MNMKKAVSQHIEMENFFTGGVFIRGKQTEAAVKNEPDEAALQAQKEIEEITIEVAKCRKCEIGTTRTNAVAGEGSPRARIFFIGEAPGADEDEQGRPFVGRAGQLLDKIITAMGLKREDVFIGNILKCRPPENRVPQANEIINCLPYLQRQIELIKPDIIVALGAYSAQTLLETTKAIGQLRGHFFDYLPGAGETADKAACNISSGVSLAKLHTRSPPESLGGYEKGSC